jgi:hypothetical protein
MKAPRREFVVEYKSTRRQTKAQPKSIWGNLDLGAVARQVDADDVLPAEQPSRSQLVEPRQVEPASSSNAAIHAAEVLENVDDRQVSADANREIVDAVLPRDIDVPIDASPPAEAADPLPPKTRKRTSVTRKLSPRPSDAPHAVLPPVELDDDIVALDAENRRLKRLMADKLRSENDQLRSILDRLEQIPAIYLG